MKHSFLTIILCCLGAAALFSACGGNSAKKAAKEAEKTQNTMDKISQLPEFPIRTF